MLPRSPLQSFLTESLQSCPFLYPKETRILLRWRGTNSDQIFLDLPRPQIWISHEPVADPTRHCEFRKLAAAARFFKDVEIRTAMFDRVKTVVLTVEP